MNFFDRYMCFNKDLMNNGYFEIVDSVMIGCIVTAARIMDLKLSTAQPVANKHGLKEKQESLDNWARVTAAEFDHIIPTDKFLDAFLEDVVTEFKLNIDIAKILKALAYRYAIISSKNVIALVGFRPSMLAASAVLVAVKILVEEHYFFARARIFKICVILGFNEVELKNCVLQMSQYCSSAIISSL